MVIEVNVMSTSQLGSPEASATRNMAAVVSATVSPLDSSTSPMRIASSRTCWTWESDGTLGPISSSSVGRASAAMSVRAVRSRERPSACRVRRPS
jgi:hypothetical protein